jgi:hypothetical protein
MRHQARGRFGLNVVTCGEGRGMMLPVNVLVVDSPGELARLLIGLHSRMLAQPRDRRGSEIDSSQPRLQRVTFGTARMDKIGQPKRHQALRSTQAPSHVFQ